MASVEWRSLYDEHEHDDDSGRVTPDGVEVAAAFAVALVKVGGVAVAVGVRFAGCARAPYVLGDLPFLSSAVDKSLSRQSAVSGEEEQRFQHRHQRQTHLLVSV